MSLLRRNNQQQPSPFADDEEEEFITASPLLSLTSAWSVWKTLKDHPAFKTLAENTRLSAEPRYPQGAWAVVGNNGVIYANPLRAAPADDEVHDVHYHIFIALAAGLAQALTSLLESVDDFALGQPTRLPPAHQSAQLLGRFGLRQSLFNLGIKRHQSHSHE